MAADQSASRPSVLGWTWKALGSLRLAVVLIAVLALLLAWATILESARGREYSQWFVYKSHWFLAMLALLGLNILVATAHRFPWRRRIAFLIAHAGLLLLLLGSIQTFLSGLEGRVTVVEGESSSAILMPELTRFTAMWPERGDSRVAAFILRPGPVDWPDGKTLDLGELNGVSLKVLKFYRHAEADQTWAEDESQVGVPAIHFALHGADGSMINEQWLLAEQFGGTLSVGPSTFQFHKLATSTMLDDFLSPPTEGLGEKGVLAVHYDGQVQRVSVDERIGQVVALEGSDLAIEIKEYLPNATPGGSATFESKGDQPLNPMLEVLVHRGDDEKPVRQIAFARLPLLNFDGIHGRTSPVKFWYHHPDATAETGAEFVQTPDGKLYCRTAVNGQYHGQGEVALKGLIPTAAGFQVSVLEHLTSAREQVTFHPAAGNPKTGTGPEAAALLEVQAGGATERVWLKRQDATYGFRSISTPAGPLGVGFGYDEIALPFSLELVNFERSKNPGRMGDASFKSFVRLLDAKKGVDREVEISMNSPLTYDKFTFYQSSFQELPTGKEASMFTVAYDPGRFLKYLGSLMICVGCFGMFYARALGLRKGRTRHSGQAGAADAASGKTASELESTGARTAHSARASAARESQPA